MIVHAPISIGELIDKITILQIKLDHITDLDKLELVNSELTALQMLKTNLDINVDMKSLKEVNLQLWNIEDRLRIKEQKQEFDNEFIELARSVYITNDKRASLKLDINNQFNSTYIEVKSYRQY